ncbi:MAG TPA: ATP-binding protein [Gammaproteobacteria bacterium]|nr:ATP-binding protein [Gammaproteobacteria bacterium]
MKRLERIHILSKADRLQPLRLFVERLLSGMGCADKDTRETVLAINEACMNVIQHAYHGDNEGEIIIEFYKSDFDLVVRMTDFSEAADLASIKSRDLDEVRPGGLGVHFISQLMDRVEYRNIHTEGSQNKAGNQLEMSKKIF